MGTTTRTTFPSANAVLGETETAFDGITNRIKDAGEKAGEKLGEIRDNAKHTVEKAGERIVELKDSAKESVGKAGDRIVELKDNAKQSIGTRVDQLGNAMQAHPIRFALGALALGYLYARIRH